MLKEARLILPTKDNAGQSLTHTHSMLRLALVRAFGGYTYTEGHGSYVMFDGAVKMEPIGIYDIAAHDDDNAVLVRIAERCADAARQESVYLRLPDGTVKFISPLAWRADDASESEGPAGTDATGRADEAA